MGTRDPRDPIPRLAGALTLPRTRLNWNPRARSQSKTLGSVFPQPSSPPPSCQSCQVAGMETGRRGKKRAGGGGWSRRRAPSLGAGGRRGAVRRQRRRRAHGENDRPPRSSSGRAAARARAPARARAQPVLFPLGPGAHLMGKWHSVFCCRGHQRSHLRAAASL